MKNLKPYINCTLEIFDESGKPLDKVEGPGEQFLLFQHPDAPLFYAILPVSFSESSKNWKKGTLYQVIRTPMDDDFNELKSQTDELSLIFPDSIDEARDFALKSGCDYFYWSEWDGHRLLVVTDAHFDGPIWKDPSLENYYIGED